MAEITVVTCPTCGKRFRVAAEKLGKTFKCTGCQNKFVASIETEAPVIVPTPPPPSEIPAATQDAPSPEQDSSYTDDDTATPPKVSGIAIASLICGILLLSPLALVFGIIGIKQTKNNKARGRLVALAGTVLGAVGTALMIAAIPAYPKYIKPFVNQNSLEQPIPMSRMPAATNTTTEP